MSTAPSPYRVLGVTPSATATEIRQAYTRALKDRRYPRDRVTAAFNRLRDPARRLDHDLREPDTDSLLTRVREGILAEAAPPLVDDGSFPVPSWSSLVDPEAPAWRPPPRPVPEPAPSFRSARLLEPPPASALPIPEFPIR